MVVRCGLGKLPSLTALPIPQRSPLKKPSLRAFFFGAPFSLRREESSFATEFFLTDDPNLQQRVLSAGTQG